jgi:hypothetical protein
MEPGEKCICSEHELYNAYGEKTTLLERGMRLTVLESRRINGIGYYSFKETPEGNWFDREAFTPLRNLN